MQIGRGRKPHLFPNGMTCGWGYSSSWALNKLYCKAYELKDHLRQDKRKQDGVTELQLNYIEQLIHYCEEYGVVRDEMSMKQLFLKKHNLQFYGLVNESDFYAHLNDIENAMRPFKLTMMNTRALPTNSLNWVLSEVAKQLMLHRVMPSCGKVALI